MIVWLWVGVIFEGMDLFPELFDFVLAVAVQQHTSLVDGVTLSHKAGGKDPQKNYPTTTQTELRPESPNKVHKGHPKSIQVSR